MKLPVELLSKAESEYRKSPEEIRVIRERNARESAVTLVGWRTSSSDAP
jgi:hypothetical protein